MLDRDAGLLRWLVGDAVKDIEKWNLYMYTSDTAVSAVESLRRAS